MLEGFTLKVNCWSLIIEEIWEKKKKRKNQTEEIFTKDDVLNLDPETFVQIKICISL